jgi:hypothetical protein
LGKPKRIADLEAGLLASTPEASGRPPAHVNLDMTDAMEPEQLLDFRTRWMGSEHDCLAPSLARFPGTGLLGFEVKGAGPESLAGEFSRFRFLLGATDGEGVFIPDEQ